ncbi:hypothetical protein BDV38DRAFT_266017 [Aspergillus pseudotamarii]|uniref:Uncharacterized protein n=1 Tax=Aspergillus pseudotamarii TaxID=132259 RepID=A0A5N6S890_ASPPS|nr:uncharacterized protein BDV38DRAFT_266017 [Aspergillus pseudotamarii]KAE8130888.1 hypothetical protein BDV38DRAFT_266017 [Aspergillus pseudotamarii]
MAPKAQRQPLQKATLGKKAQVNAKDTRETLDEGVLARIYKCLRKARHETTTELEAKAALFLAQKLMAQYNVSQADLLANSDDENKAQYAGRSVVLITNVKDRTARVVKETFVGKLARAMCTFFDCQYFSINYKTSIAFSFFGIAENTVTAAEAFEMAHNKILDWACSYKGGSATFSYRIGVADGLVAMANREKRIELEMTRKKELDMIAAKEREEAMERERELQRLRDLPSSTVDYTESEDESQDEGLGFPDMNGMPNESFNPLDSFDHRDMNSKEGMADFDENDENVIDLTGDVDDNINKIIKREPNETGVSNSIPMTSVKQEPLNENHPSVKDEVTSSSPWASETQLVRFRATSVQVADDYLKKRNIKLRNAKARRVLPRDPSAYREGWKDSQKIDFRQRRLE